MASRIAGEILHPQPAPCENCVSFIASMSAVNGKIRLGYFNDVANNRNLMFTKLIIYSVTVSL